MVNFEIKWSEPYKVQDKDGVDKWRRHWIIPPLNRSSFFNFWNRQKYKLWSEGFSVAKQDTEWVVYETKLCIENFKSFKGTPTPKVKEEDFWLPPYKVKNESGLRPWQVETISSLVPIINKFGAAVDGSELGTGKTFSAIGIVRELNCLFVVVCPKSIKHQWENVICNHFKLKDKLLGIINYELLIRGRPDSEIASYITNRKTHREKFTWKIPRNTIILWDESHRLKNFKTKNSKCCMEAFKQGYKMLFLSASLASTPLELRTVGTVLGLFKGASAYYQWCYDHGVSKGHWGLIFDNDPIKLKKIHRYIFIERGVRKKRDLIPNFPETEIIVDSYDLDEENTKKINQIYSEMKQELKIIEQKIKNDGESELTIRLRALQKTEILKIPLIEEMILDSVESGMSVVVFLNFSASIEALSKKLNVNCIYDGRVGDKKRLENIRKFQLNEEKILITNSGAAREGLNLGDEHGGFPRLSIISPNDSAQKMKQCLGRIHRENSKSKSVQKLIYISGTAEEDVMKNVQQKISNIDLIHDGDLKI